MLETIESLTPGALVAYTSDHGDMLGSHGLSGKGPCMYEEIVRILLILRWPGHIPNGTSSTSLVSHIDLAPTVLEFFGLPVPDLLQGQSLLRQAQSPKLRTHAAVFCEFNRFEIDHDGFGAFSPIRAVFEERFKLIINLLDSDELYDLVTDPVELKNLITEPETAGVRDRLHAELIAWVNRTRDPLRGPHRSRRAWKERTLSSWGGPTRPRPNDERYYPTSLLYDSALPIDRYEYPKA